MQNKKENMAKNAWLIILIIVGVIVAMQYIGKAPVAPPPGGQGSGGLIITTNPTVAVAAQDAQSQGTSVGNALTYAFTRGGAFVTSPTTAVPGQVLDLLVTNGTTYHSAAVKAITITPSTFPVSVLLNKNATVTESIYTTTGLVIANGVGVQNQTDLGNGMTYNLKDEMTANALTSTQDMVCVFELTSGNNASTSPPGVTFGGALPTSTSKPTWYTTVGVNSNVYLFDVPALSTSATNTRTIGLTAKTAGRFQAGSRLIKTCYTKENFVDSVNAQISYDVADSNGNLKSIASYTYTVYFQ